MNGVDVVRGSPASGIDPLEPGKRVEMSFSFAQETTKQILTLSTAVVAFTVTFSKDFVAGAPYDARAYITASWILFLLSIFFGLMTLCALTGVLGSTKLEGPPRVYRIGIRLMASAQILLFTGGLALQVLFAYSELMRFPVP
jgi:hypothetical protein